MVGDYIFFTLAIRCSDTTFCPITIRCMVKPFDHRKMGPKTDHPNCMGILNVDFNMVRRICLIVLAVLFTVACKKEKMVEPHSIGEIAFKIGNENLVFSELEFYDASLDFDLGMGRGVYGKQVVGNITYSIMLVLMPVDNGYIVQKLNVNKVMRENVGHSVLEHYYASLTPEINYTNFFVDSDFKNGMLQGSFSGELIAGSSFSPVIRISQGRFKFRMD